MNVVAAALAVLAAALFAVAAVAQHRAARDAAPLGSLVRRPLWLLGTGAAVAGAGLHAVALGLAPVALVQPIGVLAVPLAVLAERRFTARTPGAGTPAGTPAGTSAGAVLAVAGVAVFVLAAAGSATGAPVDPAAVLSTGSLLAAGGGIVALASRRMRGTARCLARAVAAAVAFGLVSALLRAGLGYLAVPGASAVVLLSIGALLVAVLLAGGVAVQLAYRSGPPSLVLACLTVLDPIVAVGFGVTALGERIGTGAFDVTLAGAGALLAVAGVALLARHHPESRARQSARPAVPPPAAPAEAAGTVRPTRPMRSVP